MDQIIVVPQETKDPEKNRTVEKTKNKFRRILYRIIQIVPYRPKTESNNFYLFKFFFMLMIYAVCIFYVVALSFGIKDENPHLEIYKNPLKTIPAPFLNFSAPFDFSLNCNFIGLDLQIAKGNNSCQEYFDDVLYSDPNNLSTIIPSKHGSWNPSKLSNNSNAEIQLGPNGVFGLIVEVFRDKDSSNALNNQTNSIWNTNMWVKVVDPEFYKTNFSQEDPNSKDVVEEEAKLQNLHFVSPGQKHIVWFTRSLNKDLNSNRARNLAGIAQVTNDYYVISSYMDVVSPDNATEFDQYATIEFYYQTRELTVNGETKDKTVLGLLSSLGGAFSLGIAIYVFCFGANQITPFGWSQELPYIRGEMKRKLRENFEEIDALPLIETEFHESSDIVRNHADNMASSNNGNADKIVVNADLLKKLINHVNLLERRSCAMELLFRDFVVDVGDFEDLVTKKDEQKMKRNH
ncbi:8078_t:CDS:2 [Ambispora leptoticha]|uniref:8078_t:CDS:1 n=1 Tax=Ambispora leptoticha TaxID=144679 RepID=A0A9N8W9G1_9GLOM|nr:8078_t:CDS:2 [Ambispora leptoticha]